MFFGHRDHIMLCSDSFHFVLVQELDNSELRCSLGVEHLLYF